jgi:hypothetical protein
VAYFQQTPPEDAAWGLFFLTGRRLKRLVCPQVLRQWVCELDGYPGLALRRGLCRGGRPGRKSSPCCSTRTAPLSSPRSFPSRAGWRERLLPLAGLSAAEQRERITGWWHTLPRRELFLFNKLLTGELRVGVSDTLVVRALAQRAGLPPASVSHRLMGTWGPLPLLLRAAPLPGRLRWGWLAPLSVLPRQPPGAARGAARRARGLARRVEVGRHPWTAHPPSGRPLPVEPRRGAHHRALP